MEKRASTILNPFRKIAGATALLWGVVGLAVSTVLCYFSLYHYHGLLHFGPAPNDAFWVFAAEHLVAWLIPATVIYAGGLLLSKSRVRPVDVYGTFAFAMLPMIAGNLLAFLPAMQRISDVDVTMSMNELISLTLNPAFLLIMLLDLAFLVVAVIWMFNSVKVSCNLKGWRLAVVFIIGVFGGDLLCRPIISLFY